MKWDKRLKTFTQANENTPVIIDLEYAASAYYSNANKCTHVCSFLGPMMPVTESLADFLKAKEEYLNWKEEKENTNETE